MPLILNGREKETALPVSPSSELLVVVGDAVVVAETLVKTTAKPTNEIVTVLEDNSAEGIPDGNNLRDLPKTIETLTLRIGDYFAEDYEAQDYNSTIFTPTV